jgi:membrane-bound lytic murein transglycosylase D
MTTKSPRLIIGFALIFSIYTSTVSINAQLGANSSSNAIQNEVEKQDPIVNALIKKAEEHFKNGETCLSANKRFEAKQEFDAAVDVILDAGIDVRGNPRLSKYYYELIERIYRIEVPQQQRVAPANTDATLVAASFNGQQNGGDEQQQEQPPIGFGTQDFVLSGDPLAQVKLTQEEQKVSEDVVNAIGAVVNNTTAIGFKFHAAPQIGQFINYYMGRGRTTMEVGIKRSGQFMKMARKIFREEGVPEDIVWLGQVESAWLPWNRSWAGASGLWQFIRGTGSRFDLRQTAWLDERNGFEKATRASAKYLKWLADRYGGNWELAMGAYNCGEGNVDRAIARAGVADFWAAYPYLPQETRNYVPNILAVIIINKNPARFGFGHVRPLPPLTYDVVQMPGGTSLKLVADLTDSTFDWLRYLNPELRQAMTPKGESYPVRVPAGKAKELVARFKAIPADRRGNVQIVKVTNQADLETIARNYSVSVDEVKQWQINNNQIAVPESVIKTITKVTPRNTPAPSTGSYVVKKGETLRSIASKLGVAVKELGGANGIINYDEVLATGRSLRVPTQMSQPRR